MSEFRKGRSRVGLTAGFMLVGAIAAGVFTAMPGAAIAQSPSAPVCLTKTDETGGRMRFVTLEADAAKFEQAGFQRFQCPIISQSIVDGQKSRCDRMRSEDPVGQDMIAALYGLTVSQMCDATDAWFATYQ